MTEHHRRELLRIAADLARACAAEDAETRAGMKPPLTDARWRQEDRLARFVDQRVKAALYEAKNSQEVADE